MMHAPQEPTSLDQDKTASERCERDGEELQEDSRVVQAMEIYLEALEAGLCPDRGEFLARFPEIAAELEEQIKGIEFLHGIAPQVQGAGTIEQRLAPHATLGDFRLGRAIGRGGMGVVYEAEQLSLGRTVAVKVLPFAAILDEQQLKRFRNEARAAATLDHPNIVPVYFVGHERGVHFYAMQLIEGQSLAELIATLRSAESERPKGDVATSKAAQEATVRTTSHSDLKSRLSDQYSKRPSEFFKRVAELGSQAAEALEHAHQLGIIHRDIKPGNLLLDASGKLWVTDFGLACFEQGETLTRTGGIVGTAAYMSPEQAAGSRLVDARSDIYSLGATLYELLLLQLPHSNASTSSRIDAVVGRDVTSLRNTDSRIPRDLETIVLKALSSDVDDRYQSAQVMADDLRRFAGGRPIKARRLSRLERAARWLRRHRRAAATLASAFALLVCGAVVGMASYSRAVTKYAEEVEAALTERSRALLAAEAAQKFAEEQRLRAEKSELVARRGNYLSDMQLAYDRRNRLMFNEASRLLQRQVPQAGERDVRGLEWDILNAQVQAEMQQIGRHDGPATECILFPNGRTAASAGEDGMVHLYDLPSRSMMRSFAPSIGAIHAIAISPADGRTLAIGGSPSLETSDLAYVYLLDAITGERRQVLHSHATTVESISFSPDGRHVASGSRYEDVKISTLDGQLLRTLPAIRRNETLEFSLDGSFLAALLDRTTIRIWNWSTGETVRDLAAQREQRHFAQVVWSPNGKLIAVSVNAKSELHVLDAATGQLRAVLASPARRPRQFTAISLSPDGSRVVGGDTDGRIHQWPIQVDELMTGSVPASIESAVHGDFALCTAHDGKVTDLQVMPDNGILSTGDDGSVRCTAPFARAARELELAYDVATAVSSFDGQLYLASSDGVVRRFNMESGEATSVLDVGPNEIADLAVCEAASQFAVIYRSGAMDVFDTDTGQRLWSPKKPSEYSRMHRVAYSRDGRFLASTGYDNTFRVWNARRKTDLLSQRLSANGPSVAFSGDGELVACGNDRIRIIEVASNTTRHELAGGGDTKWLQFSLDGRLLASGHWDGSVRLFNLATNQTRTLRGHRYPVTCGAFSPDGRSLFTVDQGQDGDSLQIWDVETGQPFGSILNPLLPQHPGIGEYRVLTSRTRLVAYDANANHAKLVVWERGDRPEVPKLQMASPSNP